VRGEVIDQRRDTCSRHQVKYSSLVKNSLLVNLRLERRDTCGRHKVKKTLLVKDSLLVNLRLERRDTCGRHFLGQASLRDQGGQVKKTLLVKYSLLVANIAAGISGRCRGTWGREENE